MATLKDENDNPLANKTIDWSATSGNVSPFEGFESGTTNIHGGVLVTYTAPTVTAQTSVTITASFAGNENYQASTGTSSGTIIVVEPTTFSISPSSFTLNSGQSTTLTATLKDENNNPLTGKTLTWHAELGSISPSSETTDSAGEVSVTYTAPIVAVSTWDEIGAFFDGGDQYLWSGGTSVGAIIGEEQFSTSLSISPSTFPLYPGYSEQSRSLTATLRGGPPHYMALAGKTITWSASFGSVSPVSSPFGSVSPGTTDAPGQVYAVYTAPAVTAETPQVTITASFAGDDQYGPSSGTSSGIPVVTVSENIFASTGGTVSVGVLQGPDYIITFGILAVRENALSEDTTITVVQAPPEDLPDYAMVSEIFDIGPSGTTFTTYTSTLTLPYDENEIPEGVSEDDLAIYRLAGLGKSWERIGGNVDKVANTVSVEIDHLSKYTVMAQLPEEGITPPTEGIPLAVLAVVGVALMVAISAAWVGLRRARGEATSELIDHGLSSMRIQEVDIFREIRDQKEFTIPELIQKTGAPMTVTWRTVQKLMIKGLVRSTGETKPPAAGRGKPSTVYRYVGD